MNRIKNAALLGVLFVAFSLIVTFPASAQCVATARGTGTQCFPLLAGQTIEAGSVCVKVENNTLKVTYTTTGGWTLSEAHLWIGNQITDLPQNKSGNPVPGQFPYKSGDISGLTEYSFAIPLNNTAINYSCPSEDIIYYMAAHAAVRKTNADGSYQNETGWSEGSPITSRGNWATFSTFTLSCNCGGSNQEKTCETAFARFAGSSTCFNDLGFSRWGWTNGPLGPGSYTFDIYAGAGQCDLTKGALAGTLNVEYDGGTATVTFNTTNGWSMEETHLFVGNSRLPVFKQGKSYVETVAPGQYPYIHSDLSGATTDAYTVQVGGDIYVVAHAVTCR